jgi:hypothetical protein
LLSFFAAPKVRKQRTVSMGAPVCQPCAALDQVTLPVPAPSMIVVFSFSMRPPRGVTRSILGRD